MKILAKIAFDKIQNDETRKRFQVSYHAGNLRCARGDTDVSEKILSRVPESIVGYYTHAATPEMIEEDLRAI